MKKIIFILMLTLVGLGANADAYDYMKFNLSSGSESAFTADGITITFSDGNVVITQADGTTNTLPLSGINYFYFSDDAGTSLLKGDVNGDGEISVADITALVNLLLSDEKVMDADLFYRADVNDDSEISIADVTTLVNLVLEQG